MVLQASAVYRMSMVWSPYASLSASAYWDLQEPDRPGGVNAAALLHSIRTSGSFSVEPQW